MLLFFILKIDPYNKFSCFQSHKKWSPQGTLISLMFYLAFDYCNQGFSLCKGEASELCFHDL